MIAVRLLCACVSVLLYLNTLHGDLVFDDQAAIVENKDLLPSSPWSNLLWHDFWGDPLTHNKSHKSYRPLSSATFKLNYHHHQLHVAGYHLVNVLLNAIVCYLYVQLCEVVFLRRAWSTLIAGLLFASHPLHTEAVASVVGRTELLCSLFFLLSLLAYHKATKTQNGIGVKWLTLSMVFCLCSFLSKEQGITSLALCICYEMFVVLKMDLHSVVHLLKCLASHPKKMSNTRHKRFLVRALIVSLFVLVIAVSRILMMQGAPKFSRSDNPGQTLPTPYRQLYYLHLLFVNIWLLLNPSRLVHDWRFGFVPLFDSLLYPHHLQTLLTFISLLLFTYYCTIRRYHSANLQTSAGFGLSLMAVTFLPASNLFFLVGFVVAERVLYLPSMGFCILIALGATKLITSFNRPFLRIATKGAVFFLLISYCTKTLVRNTKWLSGQNLFIEALKLNRDDGLMYSNLGFSLETSDPVLAEKAHKVAVLMSPTYSQPFRNYGALLMRQGKFDEAEKMFQRATTILGTKEKIRSKSVETYQSLAYVISMNESRIPEALSVLEVALSMRPGVLELLNMKGYFLHKMDRSLESVAVFQRVLKTSPQNKDSLYHLGVAYSKLGQMEKAEEVLRKVIQLDSTNGRAMLRLGLVLAKKDPPIIDVLLEAGKYLRTVLVADSNNIDALYGLGLVYTKLNKIQKGEEYFLRVLELSPYHPDTLLDLGYLHYSRNNFTEVVRLMKSIPHSFLFSTPEYVQIGSMLVNSYIQLNHRKEAEDMFKIMLNQESLELQVNALNGLGELKLQSGNYQTAKEYFVRTLGIDHHNQMASKRVEKLKILMKT